MSSIWGNFLKISLLGESHGTAVGGVMDGFPAGLQIDEKAVFLQMKRRRPGKELSTSRAETDVPRILSGVLNGKTTGAPISVIIENKDTRSSDYSLFRNVPRPSHADFTAGIRYMGHSDIRGGGHFSARLTAPLVFLGALCRQYLASLGVTIGSHIQKIGKTEDDFFSLDGISAEVLNKLSGEDFPVLNMVSGKAMRDAVLEAKNDGDSLGGVIECAVTGILPGYGSPFFDKTESRIASILFCIPAVKGVEFGGGFALSSMRGSQANDIFVLKDGEVRTKTNYSGGILGGITTGMPIVFRAAVKPTPSIKKPQNTLNIETGKTERLEITGRHDPCVAVRAPAIIEAAAAIAVADILLEGNGYHGS